MHIKLTLTWESQVLANHPSSRLGHLTLCWGHGSSPESRSPQPSCAGDHCREPGRSHAAVSQHQHGSVPHPWPQTLPRHLRLQLHSPPSPAATPNCPQKSAQPINLTA